MLHLETDEPEYPTSDGEPMAETDMHRQEMVDLIYALSTWFAGRNVYVSGNLRLYYERGNPRASLSPDVLVSLDRPPHPRPLYKVWEEGKAPDLVIEVTSKSTRKNDLGPKKARYASLGVKEYLLFDPLREYLKPNFQAFRLQNNEYVPVLVPDNTEYVSLVLGLKFRVINDQLRVLTPDGCILPTPAEQAQLTHREAQRAEQEASRAQQEASRAEQEARRAETAAQRAEIYAARLRELGIDPETL